MSIVIWYIVRIIYCLFFNSYFAFRYSFFAFRQIMDDLVPASLQEKGELAGITRFWIPVTDCWLSSFHDASLIKLM